MRLFKILLIIIILMPTSIVDSQVDEYALNLIEETYIVVNRVEKMGGNISVIVLMLNEASYLVSIGGSENIREAVTITNNAKNLVDLMENTSRTDKLIENMRLLFLMSLSLSLIYLINKYGDNLYYYIWSKIKGKWRIKKI